MFGRPGPKLDSARSRPRRLARAFAAADRKYLGMRFLLRRETS
jgi:hypothetical protein